MTDRSLPDLLDQVEALLDGARRVPVTITFTGGDLPAGTNVKLHDGILAALDLLQPLLEVARAARGVSDGLGDEGVLPLTRAALEDPLGTLEARLRDILPERSDEVEQ